MSRKWTLNEADLKSWGINFFRYVIIPTGIAFFGAWSLGYDTKYAVGVAGATLFNSAQNLFNKLAGGKR